MSKAIIKAEIDANITQNGTGAITGNILNGVLNDMVDDYGTQEELTELEAILSDNIYAGNISETKQYIDPRNGNDIPSGYDLRISKVMPIKSNKVVIVASSFIDNVYGYRSMNASGVKVDYGYAFANHEEKDGLHYYTITLSESAVTLQISNPITTIKVYNGLSDKNVFDEIERIEKEIEGKYNKYFLDNIYAGNISETKQYINPRNGNDIPSGYDLRISKVMPIKSNKVVIVASSFIDNVYGYRSMNASGAKVDYGYAFANHEEKDGLHYYTITLSESAVSLQISNPITTIKVYNGLSDKNVFDEIERVEKEIEKQPQYIARSTSGVIAPQASITLQIPYINREWVISCQLEFDAMDSITLWSRGKYGQSYISITPNNVSYANNSTSMGDTYQHGLTISDTLTIVVTYRRGVAHLKIMSNGNYFEKDLKYFFGANTVELINGGNSNINVLNLAHNSVSGLKKKVLLVGDSYMYDKFAYESSSIDGFYGYVSLLYSAGFDFSVMGYPGCGSSDGLSYLQSFIDDGARPDVVLWAEGMNDRNFTSWREMLQSAKRVVESVGAKFIPTTIPSVLEANIDNSDKTEYVRENFTTYFDASLALTIDGETWRNGYKLPGTDVHPSPKGHSALFAKVIMDIPELCGVL